VEREVDPDGESENGFSRFPYWKDFKCSPGNFSTCPPAKDKEKVLFNAKMYIAADYHDIPVRHGSVWTVGYAGEFLASAKLVWENTMPEDTILKDKIMRVVFLRIDVLKELKVWEEFMPEKSSFAPSMLVQGHDVQGSMHKEVLVHRYHSRSYHWFVI
jgi:hypothetical protein